MIQSTPQNDLSANLNTDENEKTQNEYNIERTNKEGLIFF